MNWLNPLNLDAKKAKAVWVGAVASILAALGFAVIGTSSTLINLGSIAGFSSAAIGSLVGLAAVSLVFDLLRGQQWRLKDAVLGGAGGALALVFLAVPLGAVYSFSNIIGFIIGVVVVVVGFLAGIYAGDWKM